MKKVFLPFIFVFLTLLVLPLISAPAPIQTNVNIEIGYDVKLTFPMTIKANQSQDFHASVFNRSNGLLVNNATARCEIDIHNPNGIAMVHQAMKFDPVTLDDFEITLTAGNFTKLGTYNALVHCNNTAYGGFASIDFEVTPTGDEGIFGLQIFLFIFLFGLIIFGFFIKNEWIVILGGMGLIALGIFSLTQGISSFRNDLTQMVALVTIGIGAIVSIVTALQVIYDEL